jgi:GxxExxY protein
MTGAGLLESVYDECMVIEFGDAGLNFERERRISLRYRDQPLVNHLRIDFLVEGCVIVELKSVECIHPIHQSQLITYLKLANCPAGLILNFNVVSLRNGLKRVNHPDRFRPKLCS